MSIRQYAELAGAEVLVFEISDERFFGFGDADMASAGAGIEAATTGSTGSTMLSSTSLGNLQAEANGTGSSDILAAGQGAMEFGIIAVEKKSADFLMSGMAGWMAAGINFTPHSVLTEDAVRRPPEVRAMLRPREIRGAKVIAQAPTDRNEEHRELMR